MGKRRHTKAESRMRRTQIRRRRLAEDIERAASTPPLGGRERPGARRVPWGMYRSTQAKPGGGGRERPGARRVPWGMYRSIQTEPAGGGRE
eukprot:scaffold54980_cov45-Attheya_sp.AAC.1